MQHTGCSGLLIHTLSRAWGFDRGSVEKGAKLGSLPSGGELLRCLRGFASAGIYLIQAALCSLPQSSLTFAPGKAREQRCKYKKIDPECASHGNLTNASSARLGCLYLG